LGGLELEEVRIWISTQVSGDLINLLASFTRSQPRDGLFGANSAELPLPHPKRAQNDGEVIVGEAMIDDARCRDFASCSATHADSPERDQVAGVIQLDRENGGVPAGSTT